MASGTSFWKIFFGVLAALVVVGGCAAGACLMLLGGAAKRATTMIAESEQMRQRYRDQVSVSLRELVRDPPHSDYVTVRGSIRNNGDKTITFWRVVVSFKDSSGNVIDTDSTTNGLGEKLKPGESKNFEILHRYESRFRDTIAAVEDVRLQ